MKKLFKCRLCDSIVRRPLDHAFCPGSKRHDAYLKEIKPRVSPDEITQKIDIDKLGLTKK